jgi:transposase InsO family protein
MAQQYHSNAKTNIHFRTEINTSSSSINELKLRYNVSKPTIIKWKSRDTFTDLSSRPHEIQYTLSIELRYLIKAIREMSWFSAEQIWDSLIGLYPDTSLSSVYRTLVNFNINTKPKEQKDKAKKFKAYEPGYLHIDVTYLPKIDGTKFYLYVAIDRATRLMIYKMYESKTSANTDDFANMCKDFFPFQITHILTDNGLEFTNRLLVSKTGKQCTKQSLLDEFCDNEKIEHRLTKPNHPQTNGMVEKANDTIKNGTILIEQYPNKDAMESSLKKFLLFYILYRRHGGIYKELKLRTPMQALEKWHELKPEIFSRTPKEFRLLLGKLLL